MRIGARFIVLGVALAGLVADVLAASDVRSVRLWRAPDNTRLVFDLSGPVQHSVFLLSAPDRIVIDVGGAKLATGFDQLALSNTPITGVRSAQRTAEDLRVVIDLSAPVTPKSFTLAPNQQYGHRLVVDLFDQASGAVPELPSAAVATAPPVPVTPTQAPVKLTPVPNGKRDIVIAIDAGHGGEDPGALSPVKGQYEKHVTLAIAKELQRQVNAEKGFRAELVRTGDYFIPLRRRTEIARKKGADLFVSIHADAAPRAAAFGASVYALSDRGATSETARWLADSENQSDLIGGAGNVSLDDKDRMLAGVLLDLSMTASLSSSLNVGNKVLGNMGRVTPLHKRRVEQAGFMVLKSPDIPSILVETGFISNPNEARKLASAGHQQALARSIVSGVRQFFHENPPPGSYVAWLRDNGKIALGPREHVVSSGESLALIAQRYQISLAALRGANGLKGDVIKVGQKLQVPATALAAQP
ncbi:N-acetylmuramoyl-L-alanine amidase [Pseudomonas sp. EA_105y_Pfl2_R69]|jgi:N-acetylmuramoyl-L-alanine amidase|uniref:N-acetylmuramoyl-L-alanine amidase n=1 Tax=Pseudomonas sp. EA_105y_Pfl2_R69 TaxID=3088683 RepID=UPI0030DB6B45